MKSTLLCVFSFKDWNKTLRWYNVPILQMRKIEAEKGHGVTCARRSRVPWQNHTWSFWLWI